jgi:hypothetical protein
VYFRTAAARRLFTQHRTRILSVRVLLEQS